MVSWTQREEPRQRREVSTDVMWTEDSSKQTTGKKMKGHKCRIVSGSDQCAMGVSGCELLLPTHVRFAQRRAISVHSYSLFYAVIYIYIYI